MNEEHCPPDEFSLFTLVFVSTAGSSAANAPPVSVHQRVSDCVLCVVVGQWAGCGQLVYQSFLTAGNRQTTQTAAENPN